ncbi:MAG: esterase/lipase family protein [Planctomycetota bacterium]
MPRLHALMLTVALIAPLATAPRVLAEPAPGGRTARFGVAVLDNGRDRVHLDAAARLPSRLVLLLHGLDESSGIWRDLLPELAAAGHPVALFEYPDDGPIAAAADLLAENLAKLRRRGVRRVDIVAHSMGGLVARDVLARRGLYGGDGAGGGRYPAIDRLVMLGTPNQGAPIARVRQVLALREPAPEAEPHAIHDRRRSPLAVVGSRRAALSAPDAAGGRAGLAAALRSPDRRVDEPDDPRIRGRDRADPLHAVERGRRLRARRGGACRHGGPIVAPRADAAGDSGDPRPAGNALSAGPFRRSASSAVAAWRS